MMISKTNLSKAAATFFALSLATACGGGSHSGQDSTSRSLPPDHVDAVIGGSSSTTPSVLSSAPGNGDINVPVNGNLTVVFSEPMDPATLVANLTLATTAGVPVPGTLTFSASNAKVEFWPAAILATNENFTATLAVGAKNPAGNPLSVDRVWSFRTGTTMAPGVPINLATSGDFALLSQAGVSTVPASAVTGDIGVSPAAATYITGFSLTMDVSNTYSTSTQVTGSVFAADYTPPSPTKMTTAISDMQTAFTATGARAPDFTELGAGDISGRTLVAGVYNWSTGLLIASDITLHGSATDVWIFQVAQNLTVSNGVQIHMAGGALPQNVFWGVSGAVDLGTTSHFEGNVLTATAAAMHTGASINGRLLAQTAITLESSTVVKPQ